MKSFTAVALFIGVITLVQAHDLVDMNNECAKELNVNPNFIHVAEQQDLLKDEKCFAKCLFEKAGFLSPEGEVLIHAIKERVPAEEEEKHKVNSLEAIEKCKDTKGENTCDTVFQMYKCYFKNFPHDHLLD